MAIDPICGMSVDEAAPKGGTHLHAGTTYYFCSETCRNKFAEDPESALKPETVDEGVAYFCPMDPEIGQIGPGICPKCGMALQPKLLSLDQKEDDSEYRDMLRRMWIGAALSFPLLFMAMGGEQPWIQFFLASPVVLYC